MNLKYVLADYEVVGTRWREFDERLAYWHCVRSRLDAHRGEESYRQQLELERAAWASLDSALRAVQSASAIWRDAENMADSNHET